MSKRGSKPMYAIDEMRRISTKGLRRRIERNRKLLIYNRSVSDDSALAKWVYDELLLEIKLAHTILNERGE